MAQKIKTKKLFKPYSQNLDFKKRRHQKNGCGIASLLMLMELKGETEKKLPNLDELYEIGLQQGAYLEGIGWRHAGLALLAQKYGFLKSKNFDWAKLSLEKALIRLKKELAKGPVMASVHSDFNLKREGHLIVLFSLTDQKAIAFDPATTERSKIKRSISAQKFAKAWKKRIIVIR